MNKKELIDYFIKTHPHHYDRKQLEAMKKDEIEKLLNEIEDTSSLHPNESKEEFLEHENNE